MTKPNEAPSNEQEEVLALAKEYGTTNDTRHGQEVYFYRFEYPIKLNDFASKLRAIAAAGLQVARGQYQGACDVIKQLEATIVQLKEENRLALTGWSENAKALNAELTASQEQVKQLREALSAISEPLANLHVWKNYAPRMPDADVHRAIANAAIAATAPAVSPDTKED